MKLEEDDERKRFSQCSIEIVKEDECSKERHGYKDGDRYDLKRRLKRGAQLHQADDDGLSTHF
jgi:hypothetical protein